MAKIRMGVIGTGWWAVENHIPVLKTFEDVELVAVCRLGDEELRSVQTRFQVNYATEDYQSLLMYPGLDAVVISSPHHLHYQHASAALKRGLHVLCEKPMVLHTSEADELASLAESQRLHFLIPYGWNYTDFALEARNRLQEGAVGDIQHVHCHMASALRDLFSGEEPWFAGDAFFKPDSRTWSDPTIGGGFAHGQLTHALALMYWITGLKVTEVFAMMGMSKTEADLSNCICCRFQQGATGMLGGTGTMPPHSIYQVDIRIFGTHGMLLLDVERPRLEIRRNDGNHFVMGTTHPPGEYRCVQPLRTFIDLVKGLPVENRSSAELGKRVVETLAAAFDSARNKMVQSI
ncbi:MAG: Gfo/Idh/MocA family oxidoreductase [Acidobacteriota bacterium]